MNQIPPLILKANIALQEEVEKCHQSCIRTTVQWLFFSVAMFVILIIGITFEEPTLTAIPMLNLITCGCSLCFFSSPPKEFQ